MYNRWETWGIRAFFCLFNLIFILICRLNLCERAYTARSMIRHGKGKYAPQDTGRQPKWLVWLLYTDVRSIRSQDFTLRLNMILSILAIPYVISELPLGWLPLHLGMRIILSICAAFFGMCTFISFCISHKHDYGSAFILYKRRTPGSKGESSIFELVILSLQLVIAYHYWHI